MKNDKDSPIPIDRYFKGRNKKDEVKSDYYKSRLSIDIIKPILLKLNENCFHHLNQISVEDICKKVKNNKDKNKETLDFVI